MWYKIFINPSRAKSVVGLPLKFLSTSMGCPLYMPPIMRIMYASKRYAIALVKIRFWANAIPLEEAKV
jgi:hypothetical protein